MNTELLRGLIYSKFKSISMFSDAMGWNSQKARRIVSGKQEPSLDDVVQMTQVLGVANPQMFISVFFGTLSTLCTPSPRSTKDG